MNSHKICFITCVNDERVYRESLRYINSLIIPTGFEVQVIQIKNATSIARGYNNAMGSSDAKYKVYLHQDVFIINKNFISDVIGLFRSHEHVGMIGVAGCHDIPLNGVWWESAQLYGKVYDSHTDWMGLLQFGDVHEAYVSVQCVDGLILITQYDVPWREDIFTGWHFYDISQSMEFIRAGYKVVIPYQEQAWCIHDCGIANTSNGYDQYRMIFLEEYGKELFPLVSILIPAYNQTVFLEEAVKSALNQDYKNCEIIICDDSTTDDVKSLISEYQKQYPNIKYYNNGGPLGGKGMLNIQKCFDVSQGEYISFLLHDDRYMPNKISTMVRSLLVDTKIKLVTSYRRLIDSKGEYLSDLFVTQPFFPTTTRIGGNEIGKFILINIRNVIGELSTVLFRRKDINHELVDFYGYHVRCVSDVALWLTLLSEGDLVYIREPLSCFRIHLQQNTNDGEMQLTGPIDWYRLIETSYQNKKFLQNNNDYSLALQQWIGVHQQIINKVTQLKSEGVIYGEFVEGSEENSEYRGLYEELDRCYLLAQEALKE